MNNPFTLRHKPIGWVLPVSLMTMAVGFMGSTAWVNTLQFKKNVQDLTNSGIPIEIANDTVKLAERLKTLETEVTKLRTENTKLQSSVGSQSNAARELNKSLQDIKKIACLTEVIGPGIQVTLRDSEKVGQSPELGANIVHDIDVLKVVNELWNAGAEAISVDDRRVGPGTNIRCVGTTILVDQEKIASPITIRAIGNQKNLMGGLQLPGGIIQELKQVDANMVKAEPISLMKLPSWSGSTSWKFATVPEDTP